MPDAGHRILIDRSLADPGVHSVALTTEEEGVALLAGADLGGARGVLLMQSSGTGNCINMLSLIKGGRFPVADAASACAAISARETRGNSRWARRSSRCCRRWASSACASSTPEEVIPTVEAALTMVFQGGNAVAVLLTQKLLGAKAF